MGRGQEHGPCAARLIFFRRRTRAKSTIVLAHTVLEHLKSAFDRLKTQMNGFVVGRGQTVPLLREWVKRDTVMQR